MPMIVRTLAGLIACLLLTAPGAMAEIVIERVIGSEVPPPYKHPASITQLDNGDLYLAYYGGSGEYGDDTAVYGMRKAQGADEWSKPEIIADTPRRSEGNPVVWQAPDGKVWLIYVNRYGETWSTSRIKAKWSFDHAQTWTDSFMITMEEGTMVRGRPLVLADGGYLLPVYAETGHDTERTSADSVSFFLRYDPETNQWSESSRIVSETGNIQPQPAALSDTHLVAYIRRGGNYLPTTAGWMLRAESFDGGHTWTDAKPTAFKNPNSAVDFIKLQSGNLLLVFNDNMNERTPLTLALSTDNDESYAYQFNLEEGDNTFAYPYVIQAQDGTIHLIYTTDGRTAIKHASMTEADIMEAAQQQ